LGKVVQFFVLDANISTLTLAEQYKLEQNICETKVFGSVFGCKSHQLIYPFIVQKESY
jgi:hypothetical protein